MGLHKVQGFRFRVSGIICGCIRFRVSGLGFGVSYGVA